MLLKFKVKKALVNIIMFYLKRTFFINFTSSKIVIT